MNVNLEDIIPESLIPKWYQSRYNDLKKTIKSLESVKTWPLGNKIRSAIIEEMSEILNAIPREEIKKEKLKKFSSMINWIKETNHSVSYTSSANNYSSDEDDYSPRGNSGSSRSPASE